MELPKAWSASGRFFGEKGIFFVSVHLGLELKGGIKIVKIIEFTKLADEFEANAVEATVTVFGHDKLRLPLGGGCALHRPTRQFCSIRGGR